MTGLPSARPKTARRSTVVRAVATGLLLTSALAGCNTDTDPAAAGEDPSDAASQGTDAEQPVAQEQAPPVQLTVDTGRARPVTVDTLVRVGAQDGTLKRVAVASGDGSDKVAGELGRKGWRASDRLEPGRRYVVEATVTDEAGDTKTIRRGFRTQALSLDQQTYASIAPVQGETVGVGMPVVVNFDVPVTDRAEVEKHLSVETSPQQAGSWYWMSDNEVHWRPKRYWEPGTDVTVHADVNGVDAGNGIYGQEDRRASFHVGDAVVMKIDVNDHHMRVYDNGKLLRTIPVSAGAPGYTTSSGIKVIVEKFRVKRMDAATTGVSPNDPNYYNIPDVEYAQRVTYSGEFIHAAPWSVGSQGVANVSHGCVGMSTENAGWLYSLTKRGDVVDVTGTDRPMELSNGFGDWNLPWQEYRQGSALS